MKTPVLNRDEEETQIDIWTPCVNEKNQRLTHTSLILDDDYSQHGIVKLAKRDAGGSSAIQSSDDWIFEEKSGRKSSVNNLSTSGADSDAG